MIIIDTNKRQPKPKEVEIDFETGDVQNKIPFGDFEPFEDATDYYQYHMEKIGYAKFEFNGGIYKLSPNSKKNIPHCIKHPEANNYIRVIGDFYKYITHPTSGQTVLIGWDSKALSVDYGHIEGFKKMIPAFDGFCNNPSNTNFERVIKNHYNMYEPIYHKPTPGNFPNIKRYMKHIFGESIEMGYDHFSICWRYPTQKLPIISLVSEETGTGKTTMIDFVKEMWGNNVIMIGNSEIESEFNTTYASKLFVGIDEGFIEKKTVLEKIKSIATRKEILLNDKQVKVKPIPCHIHFIICTNNETNFVNMSSEDSRFWVLKINPIPQEKRVYNLLDKMIEEIPAFLHFLETREISIPKEDRFWFAPHRFHTEAKQTMIEASLPKNAKILKEFMDEYFEKAMRRSASFTKSDLNTILKVEGGNGNFDHQFLKRYLKFEKTEKAVLNERSNPYEPSLTTKELQRYFTFYAEDYISPLLYKELFGEEETAKEVTRPVVENLLLQIEPSF